MTSGGAFLLLIVILGGYVTWRRVFHKETPTNDDDKGAVRIFIGVVVFPLLFLAIGIASTKVLVHIGLMQRPLGTSKSEQDNLLVVAIVSLVSLWVSYKLAFKFEDWIVKQRRKR